MDIKTLSARTGIPVRSIRYVLDHELVPQRTWYVDEAAVGRARTFDEIAAVFIACAAFLLQAGYKREAIYEMLLAVSLTMPQGRNPLNLPIIAHVILGSSDARAQYGDQRYVRWLTPKSSGKWFDRAERKDAPADTVPNVIVELNIAKIRDQVNGRKSDS